ncbi:MAG: TolC family protein [Longimicrobiales bacterium]
MIEAAARRSKQHHCADDTSHRTHCAVRITVVPALVALTAVLTPAPAQGQANTQPIELTLERMVELGLRDSYRVRQLQLGIEQTRSLLRAAQAGLKSRVELAIQAPEFEAISDYKWNSDLQRNELVHENTRRWELDLSIRQPVILFGFPTNGTLSLNNRVYRFSQLGEEQDVRYYNRYFIGYEQPLFQPNEMKNDLEEARLDLERSELEYQDDVIEMVNDLAEDYFELLEASYDRIIASAKVASTDLAIEASAVRIAADSSRAIEQDQLQVELANAQVDAQQAASSFRLRAANIKQRLRLAATDSITVDPQVSVTPVGVDLEQAVQLAMTLAPRLRQLAIDRRENEIDLDQTRGNDSFRLDLELTYGREMQDPQFRNLWHEPRNSYTVSMRGYVPIWDWGERKHRIQAELYSLERTDLAVEEARTSIQTAVANEVRNLSEYEQRALTMQENLRLARQVTATTLERYRTGEVTLVDVIQTIDRETNTAENFLEAYLGFENALLRLQELTYYDFQRNVPLLERFTIEPYAPVER